MYSIRRFRIFRLGETDGSETGYFSLTQILLDFDGGDVGHHELTVTLSPRNVIVGVNSNVRYKENFVELQFTLHGRIVSRLELPTVDLGVLSSHDLSLRIGPTVDMRVIRACRVADIRTAATPSRLSVLGFT